MDNILFWLVPVASVLALCFAYYFHKQRMKERRHLRIAEGREGKVAEAGAGERRTEH